MPPAASWKGSVPHQCPTMRAIRSARQGHRAGRESRSGRVRDPRRGPAPIATEAPPSTSHEAPSGREDMTPGFRPPGFNRRRRRAINADVETGKYRANSKKRGKSKDSTGGGSVAKDYFGRRERRSNSSGLRSSGLHNSTSAACLLLMLIPRILQPVRLGSNGIGNLSGLLRLNGAF